MDDPLWMDVDLGSDFQLGDLMLRERDQKSFAKLPRHPVLAEWANAPHFLGGLCALPVTARNWGAGYFDILCSRVRCQPVWPAAMPGRGHLPSHLPSPQLARSWDVLTCQHSGLDHLASPVSPSPWQEESHRPPLDHEFTNEIWNAPAGGKIVSYSFTRHRRAYSESQATQTTQRALQCLDGRAFAKCSFHPQPLLLEPGFTQWVQCCANKKGPHGTSNLDTTSDLASLLGNPLCHLVGALSCWWIVWIPHNQLPKYANTVNNPRWWYLD